MVHRVYWTILWNRKVVTTSQQESTNLDDDLLLSFRGRQRIRFQVACSSVGIAFRADLLRVDLRVEKGVFFGKLPDRHKGRSRLRADQAANLFFGRVWWFGRFGPFEPTRPPIPSSEECGGSAGSIERRSQVICLVLLVDPRSRPDRRMQLRLLHPGRDAYGND
jgi:hypothetical protein